MDIKSEQTDQKKLNILRVTQIKRVVQFSLTYAIEFNKTGTIMVSGCGWNIKVLQFIGHFKQLRKLQRPTEHGTSSIVISKKNNYIVSGGADGKISFWDQLQILYQSEQKHKDVVNHLLLNKNEDQLISCSNDKRIKVWKVNWQKNQILFEYNLTKHHKERIAYMSLNESETYLLSCSVQPKIILWKKNNQNKWKFQNEIIDKDFGFRMIFISDTFFFWQNLMSIVNQIFELNNGQLIKRCDLMQQIIQDASIDYTTFPIIYNPKKQIIIQRSCKQIYFLQKLENNKIMIYGQIDCIGDFTHGSLTLNGEFLVLWNYHDGALMIYKIQFE